MKELLAAYSRLQESQTTLAQANAVRDKLFSVISHDLRSPVNTLQGLLELFVEAPEIFGPQELKQLASHTQGSLSNLRSMLDNLLHWSSSQRGELTANPQPLSLDVVVAELLSLNEKMAQAKGITICCQLPPKTMMFADTEMLKLVLRNLVSNALKFSYQGGRVSIRGLITEKHVELAISDSGIGIPTEMMNQILNGDWVKSETGTKGEKGAGLGLRLTLDFASSQNWLLRPISTVGIGTSMHLTVPLYFPEATEIQKSLSIGHETDTRAFAFSR
jgi:signal transduction histidine kinase